MKSALVAAVLAASLAGCAGPNFKTSDVLSIKPGMTQDAVLQLLGKPSTRSYINGQEIWTWGHANLLTGENRGASVAFADGVVIQPPAATESNFR